MTRTSGSAGGPRKRTDRKIGTAPRSDLDHIYATLALGAAVHPKIVSERLGHSNIGITLDTYSHVIPEIESDAATKVAALFLDPR